MRRIVLAYLVLALFYFDCNKSDDSGACATIEINIQAPTAPGPAYWVFLSDEAGALLNGRRLEQGGRHSISTESCGERIDLTLLQQREEEAVVNGASTTVTIYDVTTFAGVADGMEFNRLEEQPGELRAFTIEGVQSLELLLWPKESLQAFQRDAFLTPTSARLNFELPVREGDPVYLIIRANGEAENRFLWVDAVDSYAFAFNYGELSKLEPYGPVALPNTGDWRYFIDGVGEFGATRLDYSSLPDQVSFEFGAALPPAETVRAYRLSAREEQFKTGALFFPIYFEKELPGLPASIPEPRVDFTVQRAGKDAFRATVTEGQPTALALRLHDNPLNAGAGPWLRWTAYGTPEALADFRLPPWPQEIAALREELLDESRFTPAILQAFRYDNSPSYSQFLEARASREAGWDAQQGLEARSKGF